MLWVGKRTMARKMVDTKYDLACVIGMGKCKRYNAPINAAARPVASGTGPAVHS